MPLRISPDTGSISQSSVSVPSGSSVVVAIARAGDGLVFGVARVALVELAAQAADVRPCFPQRILGAGAPDVDERAHAGGRDADSGGDQPEHCFIEHDGRDTGRDRDAPRA